MSEFADIMAGLLHRLTGRAGGQPRFTQAAHRIGDEARQVRLVPVLLDDLIKQHPGRPEPLATRAEVEMESGDNEAVLATAAILRARFPGIAAGFIHAATALRRLGRRDEAEAMARAAIRRFPRNPGGFEALAGVADDRGETELARRRWQDAARRFPEAMWPQLNHARAVAATGDTAAADVLFHRAVIAWPKDTSPPVFFADNAERHGDWATAADRWAAMRAQMPGRPEPYARGARALRMAGALAAAAEVIRAGAFMFPRDAAVRAEHELVTKGGGDAGPLPDA